MRISDWSSDVCSSDLQNLIVETLRDGDPREAVMRADALLRRSKLIPAIVAVLTQIEIYPQAADLLIDRLDKQPTWRKRYFTESGTLGNPASLDARIQMFDKMPAQAMPLPPRGTGTAAVRERRFQY